MANSSELVQRLRALSMKVAPLEVAVGRCARELESLVELAIRSDHNPRSPYHPPAQFHAGQFIVDRATFSVSDGTRVCKLGNTICFRFFECLGREPNRYFTCSQLLAAVWDSQRRAATTIRSAVFELRRQLISDVQEGGQAYQTILVYDISRWGRFQDADESAYYEYICRRSGIDVQYCAEQFENDGSPQATIIKSVKRAMAGEYSRELSVKVFQGQCTLTEKGFRQGGTAGYGLRRMLIDQAGEPKGILKRGERKSLQTDRVILVLVADGPVD